MKWFRRKLPWPQEPWSRSGIRLLAVYLANLNRPAGIEPMERR